MAENGETVVVDKGFNRIREDLDKTDGSTVDVGILGGDIKDDVFTVAALAATHEFGTKKAGRNKNIVIPERSFFRSTFDDNKVKYIRVLKLLFGDVILGNKTVEGALSLFGTRVVGDVKRKITSLMSPPNAPSVIARKKGGNNPLIETGSNLRARIARRVKL